MFRIRAEIGPHFKPQYLAMATVTLLDDDASSVKITGFSVARNQRGKIYIVAPSMNFPQSWGSTNVHILQFSEELWRDILANVAHAWALYEKRQAKPPLTPQSTDGDGGAQR